MSDRLAELRRQRALVQEHLAWLDGEIAAASARNSEAISPGRLESQTPASVPAPSSATPPRPVSPLPAVPAESLLDQYRVEPTAVRADVRKGCLLYFAAAFVLLMIVVGILYVALSAR